MSYAAGGSWLPLGAIHHRAVHTAYNGQGTPICFLSKEVSRKHSDDEDLAECLTAPCSIFTDTFELQDKTSSHTEPGYCCCGSVAWGAAVSDFKGKSDCSWDVRRSIED